MSLCGCAPNPADGAIQSSLMTRRDLLVKYIESRIANQGEAKVLFDFGEEGPAGQESLDLPDPDFDDIPDSTEE